MAFRAILSIFFKEKWTQNYRQYLSGLSRALLPTTFLEIAVYVHSCPHGNDINRTPIIHSFIPSGYFNYECIRKRISLFIISPTQQYASCGSRILLHYLLNLKMSFPTRLVNLRCIIVSYSLTPFAFFTRSIMQVMDPRFFFLLNYGLRERTCSVPYSMDLELSQQELHCIIHVTRTPDCVDKDSFTLK